MDLNALGPQRPDLVDGAHTYSIIAIDPEVGHMGVAVQSHFFGVGAMVPWAEAGVGVVATQSLADLAYGPLGLAMMRAGKTASQALEGVVASDSQAFLRQVAMLDAAGNVDVYTGEACVQEAGHQKGETYSAQANFMLKDTVVGAMGRAFEEGEGGLADRMLLALEAAEAEGGDIRGKQAAAMVVVKTESGGAPWDDVVLDLRIDDHPEPLEELRRLLGISSAVRLVRQATQILRDEQAGEARFAEAEKAFLQARATIPADNPEPIAHYAIALVNAGKVDEAISLFEEVIETSPSWRILIPRLARAGLLPEDEDLLDQILGEGTEQS